MTASQHRALDQAVDFEELLADPAVAQAAEDADVRYDLLDELVEMRRAAGLTQKQVAQAMETTQSAVSDFENGNTDPYMSTFQRYARAVGVRVSVTVDSQVHIMSVDSIVPTGRINVSRGPRKHWESGYFSTYATCGTAGRTSTYAKAA